ncbi:SseB family protein [Kocuria sp. M1R5S2]|uniref:SseB family protein n=1 Tax=Kocuria rhizosphaerae TaxID=3376285 RepID=UPI0037975C4E
MSETPATPTPGPEQQELLSRIGSWVLSVLRTDPGWDRTVVDLKFQGGRVHLRVREHRGDEVLPGTAGPIKEGSAVLPVVERLRELSYVPGRGTWFTATVVILAEGWPEPTHRIGGRFDLEGRPAEWGTEGPYSGRDLLDHLERFPRTRDRVPAWARELAVQDGVDLPVADPGAAGGPATAADPAAGTDLGAGDGQDREGVVHPAVRTAVDRFVAAPDNTGMIEVVRQCMAGTLLLDISDSTLEAGPNGETVGPGSQVRVQTLREPDGTRSLAVYTSAAEAQAMFDRHHPEGGKPVLLRQPAVKILQMVADEAQYDHLVIDPARQGCRIGRPQVEWAMRAPHNDVVKAAMLENNMSQLLAGLLAPDAVLLLGTRVQDGRAVPVYAKPQEEGARPDTLLLFTSAAEVAVLDTTLEVRSAPARQALRFALDAGAAKVCVNAHAPVATLTAEQVRDLLALVEKKEGGAGSGSDGQSAGTPDGGGTPDRAEDGSRPGTAGDEDRRGS